MPHFCCPNLISIQNVSCYAAARLALRERLLERVALRVRVGLAVRLRVRVLVGDALAAR